MLIRVPSALQWLQINFYSNITINQAAIQRVMAFLLNFSQLMMTESQGDSQTDETEDTVHSSQ